MAATVVFDGVGGGNLFAGMKFYITLKVPSRQRWIEIVRENGGEIVKLDKQAEIIIADHAKKDNPPGSISWKYIEASAKNGRLEDLEDHRIGRPSGAFRERGFSQPVKKGRTIFTSEDDRILMEWVTKAERTGMSTKGNELYKQLELMNNRHTFQSWRDRWIKHLMCLPRPVLSENDGSTAPHPRPTPGGRARRPSPHVTSPEPSTKVARSTIPPAESPDESTTTPFVAKSSGGGNFTKEEHQMLLECYEDISNVDEDQAIDAWAAWAKEYGNHTAQEWRNYFMKTIRPFVQEKMSRMATQMLPPSQAQGKPDVAPKSRPKQLSPTHVTASDFETSNPLTVGAQNEVGKFVDPSTTNERLFKQDLTTFAEDLQFNVDFNPVICGRHVPLYKVWQVVKSEAFGGYDEVERRRVWSQVAKKLNFNEFRDSDAAEHIRACYWDSLTEFEYARAEYMETNQSITNSEEVALIESQLRQTVERKTQDVEGVSSEDKEDEEYDDDLDLPSPLPNLTVPPSTKRELELDHVGQDENSNPAPQLLQKRQRFERGKGRELEIPSTPEDAMNSNRMLGPPYYSSPLHPPLVAGEEQAEDDLFIWPVQQPGLSTSKSIAMAMQRIVEPETQDFHFPPGLDVKSVISSVPSSRNPKIPRTTGNVVEIRGNVSDDSSTQSQTDSQLEAEMQAFIDRHVSLGYPQDIVIEALGATTMETGDAAVVMESLVRGDGIPVDMQGVWTKEDDDALEDVESMEFARICGKHGMSRVATRQEFTAAYE